MQATVRKSAKIDGPYRYWLEREWGGSKLSPLGFLMLNPSTADADTDDQTIRKCCGFAARNGYTGIRVVNLFAFRATNPADLFAAARRGEDVIGPRNIHYVLSAVKQWPVVCAWGRNDTLVTERAERVLWAMPRMAPSAQLLCLGVTKFGQPRHPLMLSYSTALRPWPVFVDEPDVVPMRRG